MAPNGSLMQMSINSLMLSVDPKILKRVGAQIGIWPFCDQVVKVGEGWMEQELVLIIIAALPNKAGLPND
jgi:hypothetical protein